MTRKSQKLLKDALELPVKERAAMAHRLIRSLDGPPDRDSEEAWKKEIDRRLKRYRAGESKMVSWEEVKDQLRKLARATG
jgi:putative addiction module component (TIGR02574 family)